MRAKSAAGFTMIEMIITMTIFAILVAVGIPTMRTWVNNTRVRAVTDSLQNGLRLAQAESLRRSRQVVFALTNSTTPTAIPLPAVANGTGWAIWTIPSMTDGTETPTFIQSGVLASITSNVTITAPAAAVCFNSVGRLVANSSANLTAVTGAGGNCTQPTGAPAVFTYGINAGGADRRLQVTLGLGGQVHMCDPSLTRSATNPEGC